MDFGAAVWMKVRGDAQIAPPAVGFDPCHVFFLRGIGGIAAEQQAKRWFSQAGDVQDDGRGFGGIAWLFAVVVSLISGHGADGGM